MVNQSMIEGLYYGDFSAFGRKVTPAPQHKDALQKLEKLRRYFEEKLSVDDCQRLKDLGAFYERVSSFEQIDCFGYGLRLGVLLMCEVFLSGESSPLEPVE